MLQVHGDLATLLNKEGNSGEPDIIYAFCRKTRGSYEGCARDETRGGGGRQQGLEREEEMMMLWRGSRHFFGLSAIGQPPSLPR